MRTQRFRDSCRMLHGAPRPNNGGSTGGEVSVEAGEGGDDEATRAEVGSRATSRTTSSLAAAAGAAVSIGDAQGSREATGSRPGGSTADDGARDGNEKLACALPPLQAPSPGEGEACAPLSALPAAACSVAGSSANSDEAKENQKASQLLSRTARRTPRRSADW